MTHRFDRSGGREMRVRWRSLTPAKKRRRGFRLDTLKAWEVSNVVVSANVGEEVEIRLR